MNTQVKSADRIVRTTVILSEDLKRRLDAHVKRTDRPQSRVIRRAIEEHLDAEEKAAA